MPGSVSQSVTVQYLMNILIIFQGIRIESRSALVSDPKELSLEGKEQTDLVHRSGPLS